MHTCSTHHLQNIGYGEILIASNLVIPILGTLDGDEVSGKVYTPSQGARCNQDLNFLVDEKVFADLTVVFRQSGAVKSNAERQRV